VTKLQFEFRTYARPFAKPLQTRYGLWEVREGILIRFRDREGRVGYGEIAPLPWFGTETLAQAWNFCNQLPLELEPFAIAEIPLNLPACQFGLESAFTALRSDAQPVTLPIQRYAALLPTGEAALTAWRSLWQQGHRTFKWKIGVKDLFTEMAWLDQLAQTLPSEAQLRLDANGSLTVETAQAWLQTCDRLSCIEYLEQPLPADALPEMLEFSYQFKTPIALDESVATLAQLQACYDQGWRGVFVIKPAIAGFPSALQRFCQTYAVDAVFSSIFGTAIARQQGLRLAASLSNPNRAVGYGTAHWFKSPDSPNFDALWQNL